MTQVQQVLQLSKAWQTIVHRWEKLARAVIAKLARRGLGRRTPMDKMSCHRKDPLARQRIMGHGARERLVHHLSGVRSWGCRSVQSMETLRGPVKLDRMTHQLTEKPVLQHAHHRTTPYQLANPYQNSPPTRHQAVLWDLQSPPGARSHFRGPSPWTSNVLIGQ